MSFSTALFSMNLKNLTWDEENCVETLVAEYEVESKATKIEKGITVDTNQQKVKYGG